MSSSNKWFGGGGGSDHLKTSAIKYDLFSYRESKPDRPAEVIGTQ
jgi:hypothetical protein